MVTSHTLIKDTLLTAAITGIFCCLVLVAQAYHLAIELESEVVTQTAAVIESEVEPPLKFIEAHKSTEGIEIPAIIREEKTAINEIIAPTVVEEEVPVKNETPVEVVPEPVVKKVVVKTSDPSPNQSNFTSELISLIEQETNSFRRTNGLSALKRDSALQQNAKDYSETMLRGDFMSHTDKSGCDLTCRFKADGYEAMSWGENLAMIKFDDPLSAAKVADYFMSGWKKSSGHRDNLLSEDFAYQGVGVAYSDNAVYVSVQFAK